MPEPCQGCKVTYRMGEAHFFYLTWANLNGEAPEFPELEVAREMIADATVELRLRMSTEKIFLDRFA